MVAHPALVGVEVVPHLGAVIEEAMVLHQLYRAITIGEAARAVAYGVLAGDPFYHLVRLLHQLQLLLGAELWRVLVAPHVVGDLVPLIKYLPRELGVDFDGPRRYEESRLEVVLVTEVKDPWDTHSGAELALTDQRGRRLAS